MTQDSELMTQKIHPAAVIDPSARLGEGVEIGPYAVIGPDVDIGPGTWVGPHAVMEYAAIGTNCKIHPHAFIGTPPQDLKYKGEKTRVKIGNNTVIRECVTVNRGTSASGETVVGDNCLLMAYCHVAHDCVLGNRVIMANVATLAGHVEVGDETVLGGIVAVHQFARIGVGAMLGGGSKVANDVAPFCMTQGDRAVLIGLNAVGLRRRGMSREAMTSLKNAYKTVFLSDLNLDEALRKVESGSQSPEVDIFLSFLRKSTRGLCRPAKKQSDLSTIDAGENG